MNLTLQQRETQVEKAGYVLEDAPQLPGAGTLVQLWDNVTSDWTKPQDSRNAVRLLSKAIYRCSRCTYSGISPNEINQHILTARAASESHEAAEVRPYDTEMGRMDQCAACGVKSFKSWSIREHIQRAREGGPAHEGATSQLVRQFSRAAPVLTGLPKERLEESVISKPRLEQRDGLRLRRRKRRHNRGGRHDAGTGN